MQTSIASMGGIPCSYSVFRFPRQKQQITGVIPIEMVRGMQRKKKRDCSRFSRVLWKAEKGPRCINWCLENCRMV